MQTIHPKSVVIAAALLVTLAVGVGASNAGREPDVGGRYELRVNESHALVIDKRTGQTWHTLLNTGTQFASDFLAPKTPADETAVSGMFSLLKSGQVVRIDEANCGYKIQIYDPQQVEQEIERIESRRDQFGTPPGNKFTPRESFEAQHPTIKTVSRDHVSLTTSDGRERYISRRAIVEISASGKE